MRNIYTKTSSLYNQYVLKSLLVVLVSYPVRFVYWVRNNIESPFRVLYFVVFDLFMIYGFFDVFLHRQVTYYHKFLMLWVVVAIGYYGAKRLYKEV